LILKTDIILSREEDLILPAEDGLYDQLCYFDILADYYVRSPESGKPILDLIVQLWSQSFASHIFSLLFHKWVKDLVLCSSTISMKSYDIVIIMLLIG